MTCWHIEWKDSKGCHAITYSGINAVLDHVEHCLKHGHQVRGIHAVFGKADKCQCIFTKRTVRRMCSDVEKSQILELLKQNDWLTTPMMLNMVDSEYRTDSIKRTSIRRRLYQLRDEGLIESIPDTNPTRWRVKE